MINPWQIFYVGCNLVLLVLACLSVAVASSKARAHLAWLIPLALSRFLAVCAALCNLAFMASFRGAGTAGTSLRWLLVPQQSLSALNTVCLLWSAIALLLVLQATAPAQKGLTPRQEGALEGSWPPPPGAPQD